MYFCPRTASVVSSKVFKSKKLGVLQFKSVYQHRGTLVCLSDGLISLIQAGRIISSVSEESLGSPLFQEGLLSVLLINDQGVLVKCFKTMTLQENLDRLAMEIKVKAGVKLVLANESLQKLENLNQLLGVMFNRQVGQIEVQKIE